MGGSKLTVVVRVMGIVGVVLNLSAFVTCLSLQRSELDKAILYKELEDLQDVVDHAILADMIHQASDDPSSAEEEDPQFSDPLGLTNNNNLLLSSLLRSALRDDIQQLTGRKLPSSPQLPEGAPLSKRNGLKRGFDSISQNSGFGMHRGSYGAGNSGDENLTFTFESLFPAIARGLRSSNK
ncbi:uncharacterized protein LOC143302075 [Babylonia areolata]|uniref:uncharacterized protein LOC143302075 n=1 Tax=Babylonia areolata TaxID=304850 RepID=UPI003FD04DD5